MKCELLSWNVGVVSTDEIYKKTTTTTKIVIQSKMYQTTEKYKNKMKKKKSHGGELWLRGNENIEDPYQLNVFIRWQDEEKRYT